MIFMHGGNPYNYLKVRMISLAVVVILILPLMLTPIRQLIFHSQTTLIRTMEAESGKLEKMVFTTGAFSRLNFTRSQREFLYQGNMYDIHSIKRSGSQVIVLVLWDKPESGLTEGLQYTDSYSTTTAQGTTNIGFLPYFRNDLFRPGFQDLLTGVLEYQNINRSYAEPDILICAPPPELFG